MKEMNCRSQNRHDNEDAYTERKGRFAPSKKEEDTSEAWKDSKEFQEKVKSYDGELIFYNGRLW
tara:strand:+ start:1350 stop:1541 length:192 start_codon:yes stop_codon:yes gene_type:complete